ncbi:chromosome condensation protein CrcB [Anaerobacillus alkalilacustris]|uniref:Fluoride-specific ion channel FluC n=1 Tax=Anaerobacillus alkalilacustris TaxID=393763 RepID=A0A1S2LDZ5_9BACI|nr:fluoride efflux transporter CrcB [Anaerobacillus alkalilacustris]OIJ10742.1 chromosome condensation protein CrcB [Anaerobacillus alkalilacustris]
MNSLLVMLGGAVGAMLRYALGLILMKRFPHPPIPIAMLFVNIIGSVGLGLFLGVLFSKGVNLDIYEEPLFLLVGLGFFGAFTTFSTFSVESMQLLKDGKTKKACIYVLFSISFSIAFFAIGFWFTSSFL